MKATVGLAAPRACAEARHWRMLFGVQSMIAGRFELTHEVGSGGFGTVYSAHDHATGAQVAVKVLSDTGSHAEERFERKASLLSALVHPHVVRYVAHGRAEDGRAYLAMEWLEGLTLEARLTQGPLSTEETVQLARGVAAGLALARDAGVLHRDVKPANLFLVDGDASRVKLLDFGLARREYDRHSLTRTGTPIGTPLYMSPEQARGQRDIDTRTDVYSLGAVLYECLAGSPPFVGASPFAILAKICFEGAPPLQAACPRAPRALTTLVHAMLEREPLQRPSYETILGELDAFDVSAAASMRPQAARSGARSLSSRGEQRVVCALFMGPSEETEDVESTLEPWLRRHEARCEVLFDRSRIVLLDRSVSPAEQALSAARLAFALHDKLGHVPLALCTARAELSGGMPYGAVLDRGATLLVETAPGRVALDDDTAALLEARFELRREGERTFLESERRAGETPRTVLGRVTPFVGRERELHQLDLLYRECVDEEACRVLLVIGAAGAGKSRLRHEFVHRLRASGEPSAMLLGGGDTMRVAVPYATVAPAVRAWGGLDASESVHAQYARLRERVYEVFVQHAEGRVKAEFTAAFLAEMIGIGLPDASPAVMEARCDPRLMGEYVFAAFLDFTEALCAQGPVVFVAEDLHWADAASVRLLDAALRNLAARPLFVVGFARPEVRETFPKLWVERDVQQINLVKLSPKACERLLSTFSESELSSGERAALIARAEGNPFFLEELVRARATRHAHGSDGAVPETLLGLIQARLDALGEDAKLLTRAGSVFGEVFQPEAAQHLLGLAVARMDLDACYDLLTKREILTVRGVGEGREYVFRHGLIRDAAYALLVDAERVTGHRLAAGWLEERGAAEPVQLAEHFERGEMRERAAHWYGAAVARAYAAEAIADVEKAGERARACGLSGEAFGEMASMVAEAISFSGDQATAGRWGELAREHSPRGSAGWWKGTQVYTIAELYAGKFERASGLADDGLGSRDDAASAARLTALSCLAQVFAVFGDVDRAERLIQEVPATSSGTQATRRGWALASIQWLKGDLGAAAHHARAAVDVFGGLDQPLSRCVSLSILAGVLCAAGMLEDTESVAVEGLSIARRTGAEQQVQDMTEILGILALMEGHMDKAEQLLRVAHAKSKALGLLHRSASTLSYLALAELARQRVDAAVVVIEEARGLSGVGPNAEAMVLAASARIELARGQRQQALSLSEQSMALSKQHSLADHVALLHRTYVETLLACERIDEAKAALAEAHAWLAARAGKISDERYRESFLTNVGHRKNKREFATRHSATSAKFAPRGAERREGRLCRRALWR